MRNKHHTPNPEDTAPEWFRRAIANATGADEALLNSLIHTIEGENDRHVAAVLVSLLTHGPALCEPHGPLVVRGPAIYEKTSVLQAKLRAFLRSIVGGRAEGESAYAGIGISGAIEFSVKLAEDRRAGVRIRARGAPEDLVKLQVLLLLHIVGLRHIRQCAAAACPRIFVKQYRREFCSKTCQNRTYMRRQREHAAISRERATFRRRRAR